MVVISSSGSGEGLGGAIPRGYSTRPKFTETASRREDDGAGAVAPWAAERQDNVAVRQDLERALRDRRPQDVAGQAVLSRAWKAGDVSAESAPGKAWEGRRSCRHRGPKPFEGARRLDAYPAKAGHQPEPSVAW